MRVLKYFPLLFAISVAGCLDEKNPSKTDDPAQTKNMQTPVDKMSYEQLKAVYENCQKTGKIATENYCKEVAYVFERKDWEKREQDRLARARKEKYETKSSVLSN